ncbi:diguanylate cyclase domain-containing protein [Luteimonas vadosa]
MPARTRLVPILVGGLIALAMSALTGILLYYVDAKAELEASSRAYAVLAEVRDQIDRRLETALAVPETLAAVIAAEERIDDKAFNAIAARLIRANPSIRNVALAPGGVISAIHPVRGNEAALGLRYADVPAQNAAVLRAIRTRRTVIAGPLELVQGGTGLLSRTPVFLRDSEGEDTRYWGIVALAVDTDQLFEDIRQIADRTGFSIGVRRAPRAGSPGMPVAGSPEVFSGPPVTMLYSLPGGDRWELGAMPQGGWQSVEGIPGILRALLYLLPLVLGWIAYRVVASRYRNQELARRDPLTGLANRKSFDYQLRGLLQGKPRSCALVLIDLDGFKPVNDTHGHSAGDTALREVAERLRNLIRGTDVVYRLGGDEFAILLQDVKSDQHMVNLAKRAIARIKQPIALDGGRETTVGASAGVAVFPLGGHPERASDVFDRADRALYRSKAQGGNRAVAEPAVGSTPGLP